MTDFLNTSDQTPVAPVPSGEMPDVPIGPSEDSSIPGVLIGGRFWYWREKITSGSIAVRKGRDAAQKVINGIVISVGIASIVIFSVTVALSIQATIFDPDVWLTPSMQMFPLWLAVLCFLFIFYRTQDAKTHTKPVPTLKDGETPEVRTIPSLDVVERKEDIDRTFTKEARDAIEEAYRLAREGGHAEVQAVHLFVGGLTTTPARVLFMRLGISFDKLKDPLRREMGRLKKGDGHFGVTAKEIIARAFAKAAEQERPSLSPIEILHASYEGNEFLKELLYSVGIDEEQVAYVVAWIRINNELMERHQEFRRAASFKSTGTMNSAYTSAATPFLDRVSEDLTKAGAGGRLPMLVGRETEMKQILRAIEGGRKSVVLVGEPGVGKQALLYGIAERMVEERVPKILQDKRLVRLSVPHIVSAEGGSGAEERFLYALREVGHSGNIVLVIEDIDQLVMGAGGVDLSAVLSSELEKGYTFVIATSTSRNYTSTIEGSVLGRVLEKVPVEEPSREDAIYILESKVGGIENKNKVVFTYESLSALVDFSTRYIHNESLPEKAIVLAKEVANSVSKKTNEDWERVSKEDVATVVTEKTKVPVTEVSMEEGEKLLNLEEKIHERVIGQDEAVTAIASALRRARAQLRAENRPIANFLFLGPTGVGKTETAKATAEVYFGREDLMLRFDMSEYQDKASIARLIGRAGEAGLLTEAVRQNPFSLLLLDELEKANPDILNLFLQVMDDGRLTDGAGRTVDFSNVILIATSNAGTQYIQDSVASDVPMETIKQHLLEEELKQVYRPEFLNRFDGVMVFKPLSPEDVVAIAYLMIRTVSQRLEAKGIAFEASDEAVHELAKKGYDIKFGARPLRRVVQETVDNAVANFLLKGEVGRRDKLILEPGGEVRVEKAAEL